MEKNNESQIIRIAEEIEQYFKSHPTAMDSIEGIVNWWLPRQRYHEAIDTINEALNYLIANNRAIRRVNPDGTVLYSATKLEKGKNRDGQ